MKTMLIFLHIFFFIILFLLPFSNASSLACWATINTTVEPKAKFIGFHVVNNDLVAIYSNTLIKKWQLQTGFYISEHILNESHVLFNTQQLPETSKILMVYKDGAVELRDFEENYRIDAFLVTSIPFLKILPLPNTKFLYVLKETHLTKSFNKKFKLLTKSLAITLLELFFDELRIRKLPPYLVLTN